MAEKMQESVVAKIRGLWLPALLLLIAAVVPGIYFIFYFSGIIDPLPLYLLLTRISLVALPLIILIITYSFPAIGSVLVIFSIPAIEILWEISTWGFGHIVYANFLIFEIIQCLALACCIASLLIWKDLSSEDKAQSDTSFQNARRSWFILIHYVFLVFSFIFLLPNLFSRPWPEKIFIGIVMAASIITYIKPLLGSSLLIISLTLGLWCLYLSYLPSSLPTGIVSPLGPVTWWEAEASLILGSILLFVSSVYIFSWYSSLRLFNPNSKI